MELTFSVNLSFGGLNDLPSNVVHVIDTETDKVHLLSQKLNYPVTDVAAIVVTNTIYAFGGRTVNSLGDIIITNKWQYFDVLSKGICA